MSQTMEDRLARALGDRFRRDEGGRIAGLSLMQEGRVFEATRQS